MREFWNILTDGQALPAIDGSALTGVSGGKVLQVVTNHVDTIASYLIDSETPDTTQKLAALDTSITPTASDSKILVTFSLCGEGHNQSVFRLWPNCKNKRYKKRICSRWWWREVHF